MIKRSATLSFAVHICLFGLVSQVFTQEMTTRLAGTVTDQSGAIIFFNYWNKQQLIPAGTYTITVKKSEFEKYVSTENAANFNFSATINIPPGLAMFPTVTFKNTILDNMPIFWTLAGKPLDFSILRDTWSRLLDRSKEQNSEMKGLTTNKFIDFCNCPTQFLNP